MMAGQTASATTVPLCSRSPAIRAERMIRFTTWVVHCDPVTVGTPLAIQSRATERTLSPASSRAAASRISSASSSRIVSRSSSYPNGRQPPPLTWPASARSLALRRIRALVWSTS